jgi:hypothetical protein
MNLTTTPFTPFEEKKQYSLSTFIEMDIKINILNEDSKHYKIPSGSFYKFGVIRNGNYFWFFNSVPIANNRQQMRDFYLAICSVLKSNSDIPFVFKVKNT